MGFLFWLITFVTSSYIAANVKDSVIQNIIGANSQRSILLVIAMFYKHLMPYVSLFGLSSYIIEVIRYFSWTIGTFLALTFYNSTILCIMCGFILKTQTKLLIDKEDIYQILMSDQMKYVLTLCMYFAPIYSVVIMVLTASHYEEKIQKFINLHPKQQTPHKQELPVVPQACPFKEVSHTTSK